MAKLLKGKVVNQKQNKVWPKIKEFLRTLWGNDANMSYALGHKWFWALLIGFISLFPEDCEEEKDLTPWYATIYVKKEYRKFGYSKLLNDAILSEAKNRNFKTVYLKTNLKNYYEKFGAIFIKKLKTDESLYKFEL